MASKKRGRKRTKSSPSKRKKGYSLKARHHDAAARSSKLTAHQRSGHRHIATIYRKMAKGSRVG